MMKRSKRKNGKKNINRNLLKEIRYVPEDAELPDEDDN